MLGLIDSLRALLIEAADRIEHWRGEIHCERDYLRKSKGRRVTLARVAKANARNKRMSAADRDRLTTLNRAAVAELDCWVPTARERIAECKRNIQTVEWTIRDLLAALVLVYQQAFSPRRAPEYKDLLAALEAGLPDSLLPKTPIAHLAANARRACARPATAARWPRTAEMLRFLSGPAGTIEPKIP